MRKSVLRAAVALGLVVTLAGCQPWVQSGAGQGRTRWVEFEGTLRSDTVHLLELTWEGATFGTNANAPVIVDGVVYVTTESGRVTAFDAVTGDRRWERDFYDGRVGAAPLFGDPAWHAGELLVPAMFQGAGGLLRLDAADGSTVGGSLDGEATIAVNVADGQAAPLAGTVSASGVGLAHIDWKFRPTAVFAPGFDIGHDFAVVGERVMWSQATSARGFSAACPPNPTAPGCGPDWSTDLGAHPSTPAAVGDDGVVYADAGGTVTVLEAASGAIRWTGALGAPGNASAVAGDTILVATSDGRLVAYAAGGCGESTCEPLWQGTLENGTIIAPVVGGDVAYVAMSGRKIAAFSLDGCGADTCAPLTTVGPVWAGNLRSLAVSDGVLIASADDGGIAAFTLPDQT